MKFLLDFVLQFPKVRADTDVRAANYLLQKKKAASNLDNYIEQYDDTRRCAPHCNYRNRPTMLKWKLYNMKHLQKLRRYNSAILLKYHLY